MWNPEGKVPQKCKTCRWRSNVLHLYTCDYMYLTGKSRGCKPGDECTRYEKGERVKEVVQLAPPPPLSEGEKETQRYISDRKRAVSGKDGIYLPLRYE